MPAGIYILIILTIGHCVMVHTYSYNLVLNGKCLRGHAIRSFVVDEVVDCFHACIEDCFCLAFQVIHETLCELLSTTRLMTSSSLEGRAGCLYFDVMVRMLKFLGTIKPVLGNKISQAGVFTGSFLLPFSIYNMSYGYPHSSNKLDFVVSHKYL